MNLTLLVTAIWLDNDVRIIVASVSSPYSNPNTFLSVFKNMRYSMFLVCFWCIQLKSSKLGHVNA